VLGTVDGTVVDGIVVDGTVDGIPEPTTEYPPLQLEQPPQLDPQGEQQPAE